MSETVQCNEQESKEKAPFDIAKARQDFMKSKQVITKQTLRLFDLAGEVEADAPELTSTFLRDCHVNLDDIPLYLKFSSRLSEHKKMLLEKRVSPEIILALLRCDELSLSRSLKAMETGITVSVETINGMADDRQIGHVYGSNGFLRDGQEALNAAAHRFAASKAENLKCLATRLYNSMSEHKVNYKEITVLAQDALEAFQQIFGKEFPSIDQWFRVALKSSTDSYLAQAHYALGEMADGNFDDLYIYTRHQSWSAIEAIAFLAGIVPAAYAIDQKRDPRHVQKLKAIEICAGSGGMTLGLEAAGFLIAAVNEKDDGYVKLLKENRPDLERTLHDTDLRSSDAIRKIATSVSKDEIDLIAGALPTSPFSANGSGGTDKRQLLTPAFALVQEIKPKAFFFEVHGSFATNAHVEFRQALLGDFDKLDYGYEIFTLNAKDHGVPQEREHTFLIGTKKKYWGRFKVPGPHGVASLSLEEALEDIAFPDRSAYAVARKNGNVVGIDDRSPAAQKYDEWADEWFGKYGKGTAPDIRDLRSDKRNVFEQWKDAGFGFGLTNPPTEKYVINSTRQLPITIALLKRLQGLPDDWKLFGYDAEEQEEHLLNITPPRLALAIARSIHAALTGEEVDPKHPLAQRILSGKEPKPRLGFRLSPEQATDPKRKATAWAHAMQDEMQERGYFLNNGRWELDDRDASNSLPKPGRRSPR